MATNIKNLVANRYRLIRQLGEGGMSIVYLVEDTLAQKTDKNRFIALKFLKAETQPNLIDLFKKEFSLLKKVQHPFLARVYDFGYDRKRKKFFFTCEYIDGKDIFVATQSLSLEKIYILMGQLLEVLTYIHNQGIIHNDLKPSNILLSGDSIKVLDFGISTLMDKSKSSKNKFIGGTLGYIAPEALRNHNVSISSDIFSLGMIFYKIFGRKLPFEEQSEGEIVKKTVSGKIPSVAIFNKKLPPDLIHLINQLTENQPSKRPSNVEAISPIFQQFLPKTEWVDKSIPHSLSLESSFIGRQREINKIFEILKIDEDKKTQNNFIQIQGDEGIGKSRFLQEIGAYLQIQDWAFCQARCQEWETEAYQPWGTILRQIQGFSDPLKESSKGFLDDFFSEKQKSQIDHKTHTEQTFDEKLRLYHSFAETLATLSSEIPVVIALDDIHLAGPDSLNLLNFLIRTCPETVIFIVSFTPSREGFFLSLINQNPSILIHLKPLTEKQTIEIASSLLGPTHFDNDFLDFLANFSAGNPLYLKESLMDFISRKYLQKEDEVWKVTKKNLQKIYNLTSHLDLFEKQFDILERKLKNLVSKCAIFPSRFSLKEISTICNEVEQKIFEKLELLTEAGILKQFDEFIFEWNKKAFVDWFYKKLLAKPNTFNDVNQWHKKFAHFIINDSQSSTRLENLEKAYYHYNACNEKSKSAYCAFQLALIYLSRISFMKAEQYFLIAEKDISSLKKEDQYQLKMGIIHLNFQKGQLKENIPILQELIPKFDKDPIRQGFLLLDLTYIFRTLKKNSEAIAASSKALTNLDLSKADILKGRLLAQQSQIEAEMGEPQKGLQLIEQALLLVPLEIDSKRHANLLNTRGTLKLKHLDDVEGAITDFKISSKIHQKIKNFQDQDVALHNLGVAYKNNMKLQPAQQCFERALQISRTSGDVQRIPHRLITLGNTELMLFELGNAKTRFRECLSLLQITENLTLQIRCLFSLGRIDQLQLNFEESLSYYNKAYSFVSKTKNQINYYSDLLSWGVLLFTLGKLDEAERLLQNLLNITENPSFKYFKAFNFLYLGIVNGLKESFEKSNDFIRRAKELFKEINLIANSIEAEIADIENKLRFKKKLSPKLIEKVRKNIKILKANENQAAIISAEIVLLKLKFRLLPFSKDLVKETLHVYKKYSENWRSLAEYHVDILVILSLFHFEANESVESLECLEKAESILQKLTARLSNENKPFIKNTSYYKYYHSAFERIHSSTLEEIQTWKRLKEKLNLMDRFQDSCIELLQQNPKSSSLKNIIPLEVCNLTNSPHSTLYLLGPQGLQLEASSSDKTTNHPENTDDSNEKFIEEIAEKGPEIFKNRTVKKFRNGFCLPLPEKSLHPNGIISFEKSSLSEAEIYVLEKLGIFTETILHQEKVFHKKRKILELTTIHVTKLHQTFLTQNFTLAIQNKYKNFIGGRNPDVKKMIHLIDKLMLSQLPVLIIGESGTGKRTIAEILHQKGGFNTKPFVTIACGGLSAELLDSQLFGAIKGAYTDSTMDHEGLLGKVNGGTLYFEKIDELPLSIQVKLLRVLQNGEYQPLGSLETKKISFRLMASAKKDPKILVSQGKFREDLFFRINVGRIHIPPLRKRKEDIPLIIDHISDKISAQEGVPKKTFHPSVLKRLCYFPWPGNIRQLENILHQLYLLHRKKKITLDEIPSVIREQHPSTDILSLQEAKEKFQKEYVLQLLKFTGGNVSQAARLSGLPRQTLNRHRRTYGLISWNH